MKEIMEDLCMMKELCIRLYCTNESAIEIARNPVHHDRTKHMEINQHYEGKISSNPISTTNPV